MNKQSQNHLRRSSELVLQVLRDVDQCILVGKNYPKPGRDDLKQMKVTMPATHTGLVLCGRPENFMTYGSRGHWRASAVESWTLLRSCLSDTMSRPGRIKLFPRNLNASQGKASEYLKEHKNIQHSTRHKRQQCLESSQREPGMQRNRKMLFTVRR